jgi:hypothetical protein
MMTRHPEPSWRSVLTASEQQVMLSLETEIMVGQHELDGMRASRRRIQNRAARRLARRAKARQNSDQP